MSRLSLRVRLTLWMTLIFLVVQLSLVLIFQLYQQRSVNAFFDARILARQNKVAGELKPLLDTITDAQLKAKAEEFRNFSQQPIFAIQVFDQAGNVLASTLDSRPALPQHDWLRLVASTGGAVVPAPAEIIHNSGIDAARAAAGRMDGPSGRTYYVLIGWSDIYAHEMINRLSGVLFFSIPIGIVAVLVAAYAISGVALQPIREIRQLARGLEPENIGVASQVTTTSSEVASLQQDLERTRLKLDAAFGTQERFMSNVSHELKTPISVLLTEAQNLKLETVPRDVRSFVASATDELEKLGRTVDSFLLLTRVRHGKTAIPDQQRCTVRDVIMSSYESCAAMAQQYGVRLAVMLPEGEDEEAAIYGNCDLLRTVLDNLIRNAIRFSPKGESIEISTARPAPGRITLSVRDHGMGIPPELIPTIFDRFSQSKDEQRRGRGHGIGLEIALGITELHGGSIVASNHQHGGCEFVITLPTA